MRQKARSRVQLPLTLQRKVFHSGMWIPKTSLDSIHIHIIKAFNFVMIITGYLMSTITPNQMKSEIEEHTKGAKTYEDMLDRFVNYIVNNYSLKKNRKLISVEAEIYNNIPDEETVEVIDKTVYEMVEDSKKSERQEEASDAMKKTLGNHDEIKEYPAEYIEEEDDGFGNSIDDGFDEDFKMEMNNGTF